MNNTSLHTARHQLLLGIFLVTLGLFGGEVVYTTSPSLQAMILPTTTLRRVIQLKKKVLPKVIKRESKRAIRSEASARSAGAASSAAKTYEKAACGDKLVLLDEECDDGNAVSGDGCSASCTIETGFSCNASQPSYCWSVCGDGVIASTEKCDDGNPTGGDGCSGIYKIEIGYKCSGTPSTCIIPPFCGNRTVETGETCDDGNDKAGDGCSVTCQTE